MNGPRRRRGDGGFTLIELVVAVAIMGVAFVTIVAGMMASIFTSDIHRRQATAQTLCGIRDPAAVCVMRGHERLQRCNADWPECGSPDDSVGILGGNDVRCSLGRDRILVSDLWFVPCPGMYGRRHTARLD